jgi:hypothetical protein
MGDPSVLEQNQTERNAMTVRLPGPPVAFELSSKRLLDAEKRALRAADPSTLEDRRAAMAPEMQPAAGTTGIRAFGEEWNGTTRPGWRPGIFRAGATAS